MYVGGDRLTPGPGFMRAKTAPTRFRVMYVLVTQGGEEERSEVLGICVRPGSTLGHGVMYLGFM